MSGDHLASVAERKALLRARAEVDRTRCASALDAVRTAVLPVRSPDGAASRLPKVATFMRMLAPLLGATRMARWLRLVSLSLAAYRIARNWRRMH